MKVAFTVAGHGTGNVIAITDNPPHEIASAIVQGHDTVRLRANSLRGFAAHYYDIRTGKAKAGDPWTSHNLEMRGFDVRLYKRKEKGEAVNQKTGMMEKGEVEFVEAAFPNEHELTVYLMETAKIKNNCERLYGQVPFNNILLEAKHALDGKQSQIDAREAYKQLERDKEAKLAVERAAALEEVRRLQAIAAAEKQYLKDWTESRVENGW